MQNRRNMLEYERQVTQPRLYHCMPDLLVRSRNYCIHSATNLVGPVHQIVLYYLRESICAQEEADIVGQLMIAKYSHIVSNRVRLLHRSSHVPVEGAGGSQRADHGFRHNSVPVKLSKMPSCGCHPDQKPASCLPDHDAASHPQNR